MNATQDFADAFGDAILQAAIVACIQERRWQEAFEAIAEFTNQLLAGICLCLLYESITGQTIQALLIGGGDLFEMVRQRISIALSM